MTRNLHVLLNAIILVCVVSCGSPSAAGTDQIAEAPGNDMQVVAGDEDAVEADGSIELTSPEKSTCKDFIAIIGKGYNALLSEAETGSSGSGFSSGVNVLAMVSDLNREIASSQTPEFIAALQSAADAGADAVDAAGNGQAYTADDYDPAAIADGLKTAAGLCESAGINITWYA